APDPEDRYPGRKEFFYPVFSQEKLCSGKLIEHNHPLFQKSFRQGKGRFLAAGGDGERDLPVPAAKRPPERGGAPGRPVKNPIKRPTGPVHSIVDGRMRFVNRRGRDARVFFVAGLDIRLSVCYNTYKTDR
ncbi:MAG: hypothetical protein J6125_01700, partial [Clostridia bacterium]|nr:hypothetical protein [Clostridia bacterium]